MHNSSKTRDQLVKDYERIKSKWDNNEDLRRVLPEVYQSICNKLEGLKAGADYTITDNTNELKTMIAYIGGQTPRCNYKDKNGKQLINIHNGITYKEAEEVVRKF